MSNYISARELFRDTIDINNYFNSLSAESVRLKLKNAIQERNAPMIFLLGDPGVGKSYMLRLVSREVSRKSLSIFIDNPFFDKRDLLRILYEARNMVFNENKNFNFLKDNIISRYREFEHTIFIDEAQLLDDKQLELIRILGDTNVFQFVLSMHKEEGETLLRKKHFKSREKVVIKFDGLGYKEVHRYIQSTLLLENYSKIFHMMTKKVVKKITNYSNGNFRIIKKFIYMILTLLHYAKRFGFERHSCINECLIKMTALEIGMIDDK